ncbi:MAG: cyclic nucleotide-binding domain-containing protein [Myxococcota bacterium]
MSGPLTLEQIITFLLETPMFGDLDPVELSTIVSVMQLKHLREGSLVFREGDPGDAWYVLYKGTAEVLKQDGSETRTITTLGARSCFGEMAILDGSPRSATVRALTDCMTFRFPRDGFMSLLESDTLAAYKLVYQMALVLVARQRQTTTRLLGVLEGSTDAEVRDGLTPIVEEFSLTE